MARNFVAEVNKRPEIGSAYTFFTANTPSYQVDVDRDKAKQLGVTFQMFIPLCQLTWEAVISMISIYMEEISEWWRRQTALIVHRLRNWKILCAQQPGKYDSVKLINHHQSN